MTDYKKMIDEMVEQDREELRKIKEMARESYENLCIDIVGYEENPDPWSFMLGFIEGYKKKN
jgi:hypothetical protein